MQKRKYTKPDFTNEYDSPWKEIIEHFYPAFMQFFFPEIAKEIDWSQPYEFLDTQLEKITGDAEIGKRIADKLVKVFLNDGTEAIVFIHIEIQGYHDTHFTSRMFIYNRRIHEKYNKEVVSLAILCDDDPKYRPNQYTESRWGCDLKFNFPIVKLLDYKENWEALEQSDNIFGVVVMAHLKSIEVKSHDQRKQWKIQLVKSLYRRGWDRAIISELFRFIDWVITLPKWLEQIFWEEVKEFEKELTVQYVTTGERIGIEKGELQKAREDVIEALEIHLEITAPAEIVNAVNQISDSSKLKESLRKAIKSATLDEFADHLQAG